MSYGRKYNGSFTPAAGDALMARARAELETLLGNTNTPQADTPNTHTHKEPEMKRSDAFPSQYLSKDDVESPVIGTIADVQFVTLKGDNGDEQKPAMYFKESTIKPLLVNNSNWMTCEDLYGEDSDGWRGHTIEIFKDPSVMFGGKRVGGVRLRKPSNGHKPAAAGGADLAEITQAWNTAQTRDNFVALCNAIGANSEHVKAAFGDGGVKAWLAVEGHTPAAAVKQLADIVANLF